MDSPAIHLLVPAHHPEMQKATRLRLASLGPWALAAAALFLLGCGRETALPPPEQARDATPLPAVSDPQRVLATVNGHEISQADFLKELGALQAQLRTRIPPEQFAQAGPQMAEWAMEAAVMKILLRKAIEEEGIGLDDAEIADAVQQIKNSLPPGVTLEQALAGSGLDEAQLNQDVSFDLRVKKLLERKSADVAEPSEEELTAFYEENKKEYDIPESVQARHILLALDEEATPEAREEKRLLAESLRQELTEGADFAELAAQHSEGPSKTRGGELGRFVRGQMVPSFEQAAFTQEVNDIGPVVETKFGYHIIQVQARDEARSVSLDEAREQVVMGLQNQRKQEAIQEYLTQLKAAADVSFPEGPPAP